MGRKFNFAVLFFFPGHMVVILKLQKKRKDQNEYEIDEYEDKINSQKKLFF